MANSLASLASIGFKAAQAIRRSLTGFVAACSHDFSLAQVPVGEAVKVPLIGAAAANADITPAVDASQGSDTVITTADVKITKSRKNTFYVTGEDAKLIARMGYEQWFAMRVEQSMAKLVAEVEDDLATEAKNLAGWAVGVQGTDPFASNHNILNKSFRIFEENGVPMDDVSVILQPIYAESLRNLNYLYKVNEGGDGGDLLRQGIMGKLVGHNIRSSSAVKTHTKGTVSAVTTTGAALGAVIVPVSGGTFVAGDVVSIAGNTGRKYVASGPVGGGNLTLNAELEKAAAASSAVTIEAANHIANIIMHRRALALAMAMPAKPPGGDKADEVMTFGDAKTGLAFEVARYKQYMQASYEVRLNWGVKGIEPQGLGQLVA